MKKNYFKKSLSLIMTVLMIMSCWVFVAPTEAEAYAVVNPPVMNGNNAYTPSNGLNAYGTPIFDGNHDRWFKFQKGDDWTTIYYPSNIYLDKTESLQAAGYNFYVEWHFGSNTDYRIILAGPIWGDYYNRDGGYINSSITPSAYPRYFTMTNIFSNYKIDASNPKGYPSGLYGTTDSSTDYDTRIVGYSDYNSSQGTDQYTYNSQYNDKLLTWRSNQSTNSATIYLMGNPSSSYVGTTTEYNTSGASVGNYGLAQKYGSGKWSNHASSAQFNSKGSESSYMEGQWIEMAWNVTIYDKSALNTAINTANGMVSGAMYSRVYKEKLAAALSTARTVLTKRATNQTEIDNAKNALQALIDAPEYRTYEITYENLFSLSDWWNSQSAIDSTKRTVTVDLNAGKVTIVNKETVTSSEVVTNHSGSSSATGTRNTSCYSMPVTGGKSYTFKYSTDHKDTEMYAFFYDTNGGCTHSGSFSTYHFAAPQNGTGTATFTAPANSTCVEIRLDNNWYSSTANYWDIMVYEVDRANDVELDTWTTRPYRKLYYYGTTFKISDLATPVRPGYKFDGWYLETNYTTPYSNYDNVFNFNVNSGAASFPAYAKWSKKTLDINYDNLFSLSDWYYATNGATTNRGGTITADLNAGTLSIECPSTATSADNNYVPWNYDITVEKNTDYVFVYNADIQSGDTSNGMQVHLFLNQGTDVTDSWGTFPNDCYIYLGSTSKTMTFNTGDYDNINIRFGTVGSTGITNTFSNIGLYKKADYEDYADSYSKVREPFKVGDTTGLMYPSRDGYVFDGWETADGEKIEDVTGLTASETVYATWVNEWKVTFWLDEAGTKTHVATVKNGEAAVAPQTTPTKAADANYSYPFSSWDIDFSNVTADMTVKPVFTPKAHTVAYDFVSERTCEKNAMVDKTCSTCGYVFFYNGEYDGTTESSWLKLGHSYNPDRIVNGTSTGPDGTHEIECERYLTCGSTNSVAHTYIKGTTDNADCVTPGTINWRCPCGQTKTTEGDKADDVHNNTRLINVKAPTCTEDGYTGDTYCDNCNKTVVTGADDPKLGHSFTNYVYNDDATCFDNGTKTAKCDRCDETDVKIAEDTQLTHEYTNYTYNNDATCFANGTKTATCDHDCGTESTIEAEGTQRTHKFEGTIKNNNDGTHSYECTYEDCDTYGGTVACSDWEENATAVKCKCKDCGYTKAHTWDSWKKHDDNTALAAGKMTRECTVCGAEEESDCNYEATAHSDATCTSPERTTYTCTECGHGYTATGKSATGHNFTGKYKYNTATDTHQQLCVNGCGKYGVGTSEGAMTPCSWTYANKEAGKHTATCVCGNSQEEACSGGLATCTAQAECQHCETAYGEKSDHSFKGAVKVLEGDKHAYLCEFCGTTTGIYGIGNTENATEACSGGDATCSALAVCEKCNDTYGDYEADDHKWITPPVADADNAGKHIYTCEYNNEHKKSEDCVSGSSEVVAPKCEEQGYTIQTCKECSYEWNTDYTDATDHKWGNLVSGNDGTHTYTCRNEDCGKTKEEKCEDWKMQSGVAPSTCLEKGFTLYECDVCAYSWKADYTNATGHSYAKKLRSLDEAYKRSEKTCTEAETYWYRCDNCTVSAGTEEDKYADNLTSIYWSNGKAAGHQWDEVAEEAYIKSAATCTEKAKYYKSCSVCKISSAGTDDEAIFSYGAALKHDYQNIVDEDDLAKNRVSEATCTSPAIYYKSCARNDCDSVSTETFEYGEKIGHKMTKTDAKKETCEEAGNVEYYTCSNCKKNFSDEEGTTPISKITLPALDHDWVAVDYKAPTCEEAGHSEYEDCSRCDKIRNKDDYAATGHKFTGAYYCDTVNGYHSKYCVNANCLADGEKATGMGTGENAVKYSVEFDGLDYVIKGGEKCEFTSSDTLTDENGIHSHKLSCVCGNETSKAYTDEETFVETVAVTCTADGYDSYKCDDCGSTWKKNIVATSGHDLAEKAISNGDGTHSVKCSKCDYTSDTEYCSGGTATCKDKAVCSKCETAYGATTDHKYDDTKWVYQNDATCTEDGTEKNSCTVCKTETTRTAEDTADGHSMIDDYKFTTEGWTKKPADFAEDIKAPNCKDEGLGIMYCEKCDYYKTKTAKADSSAHIWATDDNGEEIWTVLGGDCASGVTSYKTCTVCGDREIKTTAAPHTWVVVVVKEATCVENGYVDLKCDVCNFTASLKGETAADYVLDEVNYADIYDDVIATGSHTWQTEEPADEDYMVIDGVVVFVEKYPAYNADGRGYKKCTLCGAIEKVTIPAYGNDPADHKHPEIGINDNSTLKYVKEVDSTCTVGGHKGYYECTRCSYSQYVLDHDAYYIAAKGHTEPNADGKCDRCKTTLEEDTSSRNCGCICHKDSGFMKFIYKILRFFWKLFGMNKTCACSVAHY